MRLTLIPMDNFVSVDNVPQYFNYSDLIDSGIHAVQWGETQGIIEYKDSSQEVINNLSGLSTIIDRYNARDVSVSSAVEEEYDAITVIYESLRTEVLTRAQAIGITYDAYSESQALSVKEEEIGEYSKSLIYYAYGNPTSGVITDAVKYKKNKNLRQANRADKLAGETALNTTEKDQAKIDEKLSEYELKISSDEDKAITNLHKLSGVENILSFDVEAQNWNTWTPPV